MQLVLRARYGQKARAVVAILSLLLPAAHARAQEALAYETIQPSHIRLGESATLRVTSLSGDLKEVPLPVVSGLSFEEIGRSDGLEFVNGTSLPSSSILIRVTPQMAGIFSIPGLTPKSEPLVLDVVTADDPNPSALIGRKPPPPTPPLVATTPLPKGVELKAGGAAFVHLVIPAREVYVGESVPVDIEVGVRPGIVTSLNGLPTLNGGEFTLNNLSRQPERRDKVIDGSSFLVMTWHSVLAAVKPGDFSLSVDTPLTVKINTRSAEDMAFAAWLGGPFLQSMYNGIAPKEVTIASPSSELKVLPLPTEGRPKDFSGAVGDFQLSSDISPAHAAAGDPLTLRLHVTGAGNFDRVDPSMIDHLDNWKTYPAKSSFTPSDAVGYRGEKVFEQPLIAAQSGQQSIPGLGLSYFNPGTRHYEHAHTPPISVTIAVSPADSSDSAPAAPQSAAGVASQLARGLRADHPQPQGSTTELRPLYFQARFLAVPATLALILAGSWFAVRPNSSGINTKSAERAIAQLDALARRGDSSSFFEVARNALLQSFAARWHVRPDQLTSTELKARLGTAGEDVERLFALADEAKYSDYEPVDADFQSWLKFIRGHLTGGGK
jgi:hypothetical protein